MKDLTLKELRQKQNLTQEKLAEKTGLSKDYISMLERGERNPSDKAKMKLAEILEVSIFQIFLSIQRTKSTINKKEEV